MNIHPDTLARAATDLHQQRLVAADTARLIKQAKRSNVEPTRRHWLAALVASFAAVRRRPTADAPTTPATSPMTDQHAWSQP
jgi:hypothetical protein